ncbi:hypothetical protein JR316_0004978 [Psilocybe cubensis]|uniref:Uncharacterized protein n=2 Tax=Psilocybe cubensis TaxID=181762 RepID=A0ACB8H528_PSICU|nr:hypothetical protein JR316_0004978 [Psilocybe cubensis]KAH9482878.1 hypothetical protein JR316_0004978 [Psilocybe cubensis]
MPLFGTRTRRTNYTTTTSRPARRGLFGGTRRTAHTGTVRPARRGFFSRRPDKDRVAGGYKVALANPNTTHSGRKHAKRELRAMGRDTHVPFMTKVKRTLGIRSTPSRRRTTLTKRTVI